MSGRAFYIQFEGEVMIRISNGSRPFFLVGMLITLNSLLICWLPGYTYMKSSPLWKLFKRLRAYNYNVSETFTPWKVKILNICGDRDCQVSSRPTYHRCEIIFKVSIAWNIFINLSKMISMSKNWTISTYIDLFLTPSNSINFSAKLSEANALPVDFHVEKIPLAL